MASIMPEQVVRLVLQFLDESGLDATASCLRRESGIGLLGCTDIDRLRADVIKGRWDKVLPAASKLQLPCDVLIQLCEQASLELLEAGEIALCEALLATDAMQQAMAAEGAREHCLKRAIARAKGGDRFLAADFYSTAETQEQRREQVSDALTAGLLALPPARLLTILHDVARSSGLQEGDTWDPFSVAP